MHGEFPGLGSFGAFVDLMLTESAFPWELALLHVWASAYGIHVGLGLTMSPAQSRSFAAGSRVEFEETEGVNYGRTATDVVIQGIRSVQMKITDGGVATLEFELGAEVARLGELPADFGPVDGFWVGGALHIPCDTVKSGAIVQEDPYYKSEFCQQAIAKFGLEELARYDLERRSSQ